MHYTGVPALEDLVDRYLVDGDESAIEAVVRRTQGKLLRAARGIAPDDAEDCVQTAYLSLVHKRGAGLDAPVWPWLLTAVVRTAYRHKAQRQRRTEIARQLVWVHERPGPVESAIVAENRAAVRRGVDRLPARLRDAVVLHDLQGLSTPETAVLLGISDAGVRVRLQRARRILRARLPRVVAALLALPWWLGDHAAAAVGGLAMKPALPLAALVLLLLLGAATLAPRFVGRPEIAVRTPHRADAVAAPAAPAPPETPPAPPPPDAPAPGALAGKVMDLDGNGIAGARVVWHALRRAGVTTRSAVSNADGRYRVPAPAPDRVDSFVTVDAEGFAPLTLCVGAPAAGAVSPINFVLTRGARLEGLVVDGLDRPVAGAAVRLWSLHLERRLSGPHPFAERLLAETEAGPDGRFAFPHAPAAGFHHQTMQEACVVAASTPAARSGARPLPFARPGEVVHTTLRLHRPVAVSGRVVDAAGAAVDGAVVVAYAGMRHAPDDALPGRRAVTGPDGRFFIAAVMDTRDLGVVAHTAGGVSRFTRAAPGAVERATGDVVVETRVAAPAVVRVVDEQGAPVPRAAVQPRPQGTLVRTDAAGRAEVRTVRCSIRAEGFGPAVAGPLAFGGETRVVLRKGAPVRGTIAWADGAPAAGVTVHAWIAGVPVAFAKADAAGAFVFDCLAGADLRADYGSFGQTRVARGPATDGAELVFSGPKPGYADVRGVLRDGETGEPVKTFRAYVKSGTTPYGVLATAPGKWSFRLPEGTHAWFVVAPGYPRYDGTITVPAGAETVDVDVDLPRGLTVRGVMSAADGASYAGAKLRLLRADLEWGATVDLRDDGSFEVPHVLPGTYLPEVHRPRGRAIERLALAHPGRVEIAAGTTLALTVVPGVSVDVRVARRGLPRGAAVTLHDAGGALVGAAKHVFVDRGMAWAARGWSAWSLPPGHYEARFLFPGADPLVRPFDVRPGEARTLELE